jgi:chaperonin GroEL
MIAARALYAPLRHIADNAGASGAVIMERVRELPFDEGYDAVANKFVNMFEAGIVDPAKVTRSSLQNAASIGGMVLTTEGVVVEKPDKQAKAPAGVCPGEGFDY